MMSKPAYRFAPEVRQQAVRMMPEREKRELRQANKILRKAFAYCAQAERACERAISGKTLGLGLRIWER